ncbi:MAG: septal ring lytic transglycosylase RlpA family protein [Actinomycetota bacterium]|nr:septal ring lytic transglycosylase RlpA family protein [Actinomycetota bacterium]
MSHTVVERLAPRAVFALVAILAALLSASVFADRGEAKPVTSSYYGEELTGSPTASGEPFDPYDLTAAHPTLPFGTQLLVCYQGCVTVTVNDRGPFVAGRGLDLSLGAAQAVGLTAAGVDVVDVTVLGAGATPGVARTTAVERLVALLLGRSSTG